MRSITGLSMGLGGRSLLLDVAGAVQADAKPGKKKSIIISNIHTYRVAPGDLMNYIAARARIARRTKGREGLPAVRGACSRPRAV